LKSLLRFSVVRLEERILPEKQRDEQMPASATSVYMILATIDPWPPHIHATISNLNRPMLPQLSAPIITKISDILSIIFLTPFAISIAGASVFIRS